MVVAIVAVMVWGCGCRMTQPPRSLLATRDAETPAEETVVIAGYILYFFSGSIPR